MANLAHRARADAPSGPSADAARPEGSRLPITARRHPVVAEVAARLRDRCGVDGGGTLVVAVSGGADSVALLVAMTVLRDRGGADPLLPIAVHVHHHLRDREADEDAAFVTDLCRDLGVPLRVEHVEPGRLPGNVAENARCLRYASLRRVAEPVGATGIAVGHHADDQLETMLMALGRGAGVDGLSGMSWRRDDDGGGAAILRPLLGVRASACAELCTAAGIEWRRDPSNDDPARTRARLRLEVMPVLEALWPDAARRAVNAADSIDAARFALERCVAEAFGPPSQRRWHRDSLASLPAAIVTAGLRRAALHAVPEAQDDLAERVVRPAAVAIATRDTRPRRFDWPRGLVLRVTTREVGLDSMLDSD